MRSLHHTLAHLQAASDRTAAPLPAPVPAASPDLSFAECGVPAGVPRPEQAATSSGSEMSGGSDSSRSMEHSDEPSGSDSPVGAALTPDVFLTPRSGSSDVDGVLLLAEGGALTRRNPLCTGALADLWGAILPMLGPRLALLERAAADGSEHVAFCERLDGGLWAQTTVQGEALRCRLMAKLMQLQRMRMDVCDDDAAAASSQRHTLRLFSMLWAPKGLYAIVGPSLGQGALPDEFHCLRVSSVGDMRAAARTERTAADEQAAALRALRPQAGRSRLVPHTDGSFVSMAVVVDVPLDGRMYTAFTALPLGCG